MGEIYLIKSPSHKIYIGQTIYNHIDRFRDHVYDAFDPKKDHCKKLNRAIRKYGKESFYIELVTKCDTITQLNTYERLYIRIFDSIKNGYNIKQGGRNGKHSEKTKIKIGKALKGKPKPQSMKINLSKSRNKHGLPMYMIKSRGGYRVVNHPLQNGKDKHFLSKSCGDKYNYDRALKYLKELNAK